MPGYLAAIWRCRYFWWSLVRMDLRTRYRRSLLGVGWSLLHPLAMTAILCLVFHRVFQAPVREYLPFLLAGMICWTYTVSACMLGAQSFLQAEAYIRQCPVPLAIYPLRTTLGASIHFLVALAVVVAVAWYGNGPPNPLALLSLIPSFLLFFLLNWSLAVLAGAANVLYQDTEHLCQIGFQILFYATPVMYPAQVLRTHDLAWVLNFNPLVAFLQLIRQPILEGRVPDLSTYGTAGITAALAAAVATLVLARMQRRLVFFL